jgi:hypothetical protein
MPYQFGRLRITVVSDAQYLDPFGPVADEPGPQPQPDGGPTGPTGPQTSLLAPVLDTDELRGLLHLALLQLGGPLRQEELRPRSVEELDTLERELADALREVRDQRARFGV